jgi:ribosome biogenesis GTPase A
LFDLSFAFLHHSTATYRRWNVAANSGRYNARITHSRFAITRLQRLAPLSAVVLTREQMLQLYNDEDEDEDELSFLQDPGKNYSVGFMSVVGHPNVGKSTLLNAILGDKLSIVSPKPQTTRHEIVGVLTTSTHQLIVRDTPGVLQPKYALQSSMMKAVKRALSAADVYLLLTDVTEPLDGELGGGQPVSLVLEKYAQMLNVECERAL